MNDKQAEVVRLEEVEAEQDRRIKALRSKIAHNAKMDEMLNFVTGVGSSHDKSQANVWYFEYPNPYTLDAMHQSDTVVARMVEVPPRDALAKGFEIKSPAPIPWRSDVEGDALANWMRRKRVLKHMQHAIEMARLYGGAGIVMHIDDGRAPHEPVDRDNIKSITLTRPRDRWELTPIEWFDDFDDPRYEDPMLYSVNPRSYGGTTTNAPSTIHADRLLRFDGYSLAPDAYARNLWWGGSIVWRAKERIERFVGSEQAMHVLLTEAKEDVLFLQSYRDIEATSAGKSAIQDRATDVATSRSMLGMTILDAADRYETRMRPLGGVADIHDRAMQSVAQAAEMPATLLFGDAARGLSADDKAGRTYYAASITAMQQDTITPALEHLLIFAFLSQDGPTAGENSEGWYLEFPPYEDETDGERADREKAQAEADAINIGAGIYTAEEARRGRYVVGAPGAIQIDESQDVEEVDADGGEAGQSESMDSLDLSSMMAVAEAVSSKRIAPAQAAAILVSQGIDARTARAIAGIEEDTQLDRYPSPPREPVDTGLLDEDDESLDADEPTDFPEQGGTKKVSLRNSQHKLFDPAYAADLKENWPEIWSRGGNIEGNNQYRRLTPIAARGGNVETDTEDMAVRKREAWGSRHKGNRRINGVVALIKWLVVGDIGEARMKRIIEDQKDRIRKKRSKEKADEIDWVAWMPERSKQDDDAKTPAPPEDRIEGSAKNKKGSASGQRGGITIDDATEKALRRKVEEHNEKHEAKSKRVNLGMLKAVWRRGAGAFSTSHRPGMTRPQWSMGRVNAFLHLVSKGKPKAKTYTTDNDLLPEGHPRKSEKKKDGAKMDPYSGPDDPGLPEKVHEMSAEARNRFFEAFNAAHREDPEDEGRAFAIAYAAAEKG